MTDRPRATEPMTFTPRLPRPTRPTFEGVYEDEDIDLRRLYYWGAQYESLNDQIANRLGLVNTAGSPDRLKEHQRIHAYSTHIQEGVDFLADQITGQMILQPAPKVDAEGETIPDSEDPTVAQFLADLWRNSRLENRNQEVAREVLIAGNLVCEIVMVRTAEPEQPGCVLRFWQVPNEARLHYSTADWTILEKVEVFPNEDEVWVYRLNPRIVTRSNDLGENTDLEADCIRQVWEADSYRSDSPRLLRTEQVGLPFIPFVHLHGENEGLRSMFGRSMISKQLMQTADRYNATRQLEYLAVRYNSFATLAVVGDMVHLQDSDPDSTMVLRKDLGEFITFPGGSQVHTIELPTDTALIQDQTESLVDSMYGLMGLERIDKNTISSFGGVSGYALEILNRKTQGTFTRITESMREGFQLMIDMALDVDAYATAAAEFDTDLEQNVVQWWTVDPDSIWPEREVIVDFGSAYIVDEVATRDDWVSRLISRNEGLRKRGYTQKEIDKINSEIEDQATAPAEDDTLEQRTRFSTERA